MKTYQFRLPDIGEGVAEAEITAWYVKVGEDVEEDQTLVDVMTDKATIDMTSPVAGKVLSLNGAPGDKISVGSVLVELAIAGEGMSETTADPAPPAPDVAAPRDAEALSSTEPLTESTTEDQIVAEQPKEEQAQRSILIAPATRRRAEDLKIDLEKVTGTGPDERITDADLDAYLKAQNGSGVAARQPREGVKHVKIIGMRRKIAERMAVSARTIPHFSYVEDCDMSALEGLRREINASRQGAQPKLTLLPFFMRALAQLLPEFPHINAHYEEEAGVLHQYEGIHIGIATQTAEGLMVPVVRHVEALDIWDCAREMSRVSNAAREGRASREELSGSTITLTSLGALGGVAATPIINHPEVAIIGPNKLMARPVFINSQVTVRTMMNLSSSFDHRIVDGYDAARFIQRLKRLLENPALIFVEKRNWE